MTAPPAEVEGGSFRDPASRVFYRDGEVLRALSHEGLRDWQALSASAFFARFVKDGKLVATDQLDGDAPLPDAAVLDAAAVLRHERVPFVSYPYEWPFSMLRDAALLELELLEAALAEDMTLKDASPYNVQWRGARPVFVDVGSFARLAEGEPWAGYRQFCMLFLYPLLLEAYKGVAFQPWLRGRLDGVAPEELRRLLSLGDLLRPGVLSHVVLHARLERRHGGTERDLRGELRAAGFRKELIAANAGRLRKLVARLEPRAEASPWSAYRERNPYSEADAARKADFVREVVATRRWGLVWDLGCNDGRHARIAAERASTVVALDADGTVVDRLYRALRDERSARVLPLVMDVADPSPGLGWRGRERKPLAERGRPELTLCLALLHHVSIGGNVPVADFVDWLRALGGALVIEFVGRDDPMVRRLLAPKREGMHADYAQEPFERRLTEAFHVERREPLASGTRVLYFARPRD